MNVLKHQRLKWGCGEDFQRLFYTKGDRKNFKEFDSVKFDEMNCKIIHFFMGLSR